MDPYQILDLPKKFTLQELKDKYKTLAIKVHPDKGGTEELFLLVTKCYKMLLEEYKKKTSQKEYHELKADFQKNQAKPKAPTNVPSREGGKFDLDRFNQVFSDNKLENAYDKGYKDWMTDEQVKDIPKPKGSFKLDSFNDRFEKNNVDKTNKYIIKYREPEPLMASKKIGFTELGEEDVDDFSGDNTNKRNLNYMDYKVAHTTSKIVDPKLLKNVKSFKNVEELEKHRGSIRYEMDEDTMEDYEARMKLEKLKERQRKEAMQKQEQQISDHYERVNMLFLGRKG